MIRMRVKGTVVKPASSPDSEPDFYRMEYCSVPSDGFFDCYFDSTSLLASSKALGANSAHGDDALSKKDSEIQLVTSQRKKRVGLRKRLSMENKFSSKADLTETSALTPGASDTSVATASFEATTSVDLGEEHPNDDNDCSSGMNLIRSHTPYALVNSCSASASNTNHECVSDVPIASGSTDESVSIIGSLDIFPGHKTETSDEPHTGGIKFFEGKPFCFMDQINFDTLPAAMDREIITPLLPDDDFRTLESGDPSAGGDSKFGGEKVEPCKNFDDVGILRYIG
jgi:hypothetical protein